MINTNPTNTNDMSAYRQRRLELGEDDILNSNVSESYSNIPILNNVDNKLEKKMIWVVFLFFMTSLSLNYSNPH